MVNRQRLALAAISISCLLPTTVYAGAGGTPVAPGAGRSTDYCCAAWESAESRRQGNTLSFLNGTGCQAIPEDPLARNECGTTIGAPGSTVVKCRGELFTPSTGKVERCLTP